MFTGNVSGIVEFNYTINKPDPKTNWIPRLAFGIYDTNGFKEPEDMSRIG